MSFKEFYFKKTLICLLLCICFIMVGCHAPVDGTSSLPSKTDEVDSYEKKISDTGDNYIMYMNYYNDAISYGFDIYDNEKNIILSEEWDSPVQLHQLSDDIVEVDVHMGEGFREISQIRFCDVQKKKVSEIFDVMHPILVIDKLLIYDAEEYSEKGLILVATDIFEPSKYYKQFVLDGAIHVSNLEEVDNKTIKVQYIIIDKENGYKDMEKTTVIHLDE